MFWSRYLKAKSIVYRRFKEDMGLNFTNRCHPPKVSVEDIKANGYNLDIKNPFEEKEKHRDLGELLQEHQELMAGVSETRNLLKAELMQSLDE